MITKFQNGGQAKLRSLQLNKLSSQQLVILAIILSIEQAPELTVDALMLKGMNPQQLMLIILQLYQGLAISPENAERASARLQLYVQSAAKGAKLQYISSLKNKCKEGEELVYMKAGGRVCPVCQKKKVQAEKCGGSTKKFKKMWDGGEMPSQQQKKSQQKTQQKPTKQTPLPTKWDLKKHDELIRKFKKNPKGMSKAQMDSLHYYNMKDPREQGV